MNHTIEDDKGLVEKAENITCVSDYLDVLSYINKKRKDKNTVPSTMFFRGSSDESRPDEPSIYRKIEGTDTTLVECEKNLYYDIISRCPDAFRHCDTALDNLVMMQHYGLPTRLLDITENPLVALYFACKNHEKETKAVVSIYEVGNIEIRNYNSDTAAMIANLAKMDIDFSSLQMKCKQIIRKIEKGKYETYDKCKKDLLSLFNEVLAEKQLNKVNLFKEFCTSSLHDLFKEEGYPVQFYNMKLDMDKIQSEVILNDSYNEEIKKDDVFIKNPDEIRLLHFIQSEKPYFDGDRIDVKDLENVIFIKTKQDNPNIIKQNGAFILFGVKKDSVTKRVCPSIPEYYYFLTEQGQKKIRCIIDQRYKKNIVDELDALSISESQLFPEISKVAGYFSDKYSDMIKSDFIKTTPH